MKEKKAEEQPKAVEKINKKELRRLTEILKDETVSNVEKNKVARTIFKEIVKGGDDGKPSNVCFGSKRFTQTVAICTTVLRNNEVCKFCVCVFNVDRIL